MTVYWDVILLREWLIDGVILLACAWMRKMEVRHWRLILAALIGAIYTTLWIFPQTSFLYHFTLKIVISLLMVLVAFGFKGIQSFLRNVVAFYMVSFVASGAVTGIYYLLLQENGTLLSQLMLDEGTVQVKWQMGLLYVLGAFGIGLWIKRSVFLQHKERGLLLAQLAEVKIYIDEACYTCTGLIDTGNHLYDPLSRSPVLIMEARLWEKQLPPSWLTQIEQAEVERLVTNLDEEPFAWQHRVRLVPYRGVNSRTSFMLAVKPDRIEIEHDGQVHTVKKSLVGLEGGKLTAEGSYQAIVHPTMVDVESS